MKERYTKSSTYSKRVTGVRESKAVIYEVGQTRKKAFNVTLNGTEGWRDGQGDLRYVGEI